MKTHSFALSFCMFLCLSVHVQKVFAQVTDTTSCPYDCCRPDGHAPLGIMTDHVHDKGEWGFSYSYTNTQMAGNQSGATSLNRDEVLHTYMVSPTRMTMQMHMVMAMYGITKQISVMGMFSFMQNSMSMYMNADAMNMPGMSMSPQGVNNGTMVSKSMGLGDTRLYGLYKLYDRKHQRIIVCFGFSLPTGSISQSGLSLLGEGQRLPYNMQTGSGTVSLLPGITYTGQLDHLSWGLSAEADLKPGMNSAGYAPGNMYRANAWLSYRISRWFSVSLRGEEMYTNRMNGYDPAINLLANNDPTANSLNYGGQMTNAFVGLNFFKPTMPLRSNRLMIEYGLPLYQNLNGIQMTTTSTLIAGWQYNF